MAFLLLTLRNIMWCVRLDDLQHFRTDKEEPCAVGTEGDLDRRLCLATIRNFLGTVLLACWGSSVYYTSFPFFVMPPKKEAVTPLFHSSLSTELLNSEFIVHKLLWPLNSTFRSHH